MTDQDKVRPFSGLDVEAARMYLASCLEKGVCPTCGRRLTPTGRYGTGALADGIYCSLKCFSLPPAI